MEFETIRVNANIVKKLRKFLFNRTEGKLYGEMGKTAGMAIEEWLDRTEGKKKGRKR
jgi:hypothetical protein